ncbi:Alpha-1,3-mannosyltransferase cmt1 [Trifolium repens]|nr:Alpha-1,3-mannosyltransferase cmt1 [Trifolium repens]
MSTGLCFEAFISGIQLVTRWAVDINEYACESLKLFATTIPMKKRNQDCTLKCNGRAMILVMIHGSQYGSKLKFMQESNCDYNCNSECKDAMRDFVTQGYKEKVKVILFAENHLAKALAVTITLET